MPRVAVCLGVGGGSGMGGWRSDGAVSGGLEMPDPGGKRLVGAVAGPRGSPGARQLVAGGGHRQPQPAVGDGEGIFWGGRGLSTSLVGGRASFRGAEHWFEGLSTGLGGQALFLGAKDQTWGLSTVRGGHRFGGLRTSTGIEHRFGGAEDRLGGQGSFWEAKR